MRVLRRKLTYANVIATLALFLALTGGVVWAARKIGSHQLKASSVTTGKIKKSAVTSAKLKDKAVTNPKLGEGAVNFAKIASGTNVVASASGTVGVSTKTPKVPIALNLSGTTAFTPAAGVIDLVSIEVRAVNFASIDPKEACAAEVQPMVNGQLFQISSDFLFVRSAVPEEEPPSASDIDAETGPIGLGQPGTPQQLGIRVIGSENCSAASQVAVNVAVTQFK